MDTGMLTAPGVAQIGMLNYHTNAAIAFQQDVIGRMAISHVPEVYRCNVNADWPWLQQLQSGVQQGNLTTTPHLYKEVDLARALYHSLLRAHAQR